MDGISSFYCVSISYRTNKSHSFGASRSHQMSEKGVLNSSLAGPATFCSFTRWLMPPILTRWASYDFIVLFGAFQTFILFSANCKCFIIEFLSSLLHSLSGLNFIWNVAATPGQKCGICGHIMASFDPHKWCARCHKKLLA